MAYFHFTLDDLKNEKSDPWIRELTKFQTDPNKPFVTTRSVQGTAANLSTLSVGELMMGIPAYNSGQDILGFQDKVFSDMLNVSLIHSGSKETAGSLTGANGIPSPVDYLVPTDIRTQAKQFIQEAKNPIYPDSVRQNTGLNDQSGQSATGTQGDGSASTTPAGGVAYSPVDQANLAKLLEMPNFKISCWGGPNWKAFANGWVKPPLIKFFQTACQLYAFDMFTWYMYSGPHGDPKPDGGVSNHSYFAAIDMTWMAWGSDPHTRISVQKDGMNPIFKSFCDFVNTLHGVDKPDEVGGPANSWVSVYNKGNGDPFYHDAESHIHVGYEYNGDPGPNGQGGIRASRWQ